MQIVIEISEQKYNWIVNNPQTYTDELHEAIRTGIPLPNNHGRMIDVDELYENTEIGHDEEGYACVTWKAINDAPTIIEAEVSGDDE